MSIAIRSDFLTADDFLTTDQRSFGSAWRYELVNGRIVAHDAPSPEHGAVGANLTYELISRMRGHSSGCRVEIGSGAVPKQEQHNTARIPDIMIRCGDQPRVVFEVISPTDLRNPRTMEQRRDDLQRVEGVREVVELYQDRIAVRIYRPAADGTWTADGIEGADAVLEIRSVGLTIPLGALYEGVDL
jgi:Uma2 family endonuclease